MNFRKPTEQDYIDTTLNLHFFTNHKKMGEYYNINISEYVDIRNIYEGFVGESGG